MVTMMIDVDIEWESLKIKLLKFHWQPIERELGESLAPQISLKFIRPTEGATEHLPRAGEPYILSWLEQVAL